MLDFYSARVAEALRSQPAADPFTYSSVDQARDFETHTKRIIEKVLSDAPGDVKTRLLDEYLGAGPLESLLADPTCTEIVVNGADSIWFEKSGRLVRANDKFMSELTMRNFIARMSREAGVIANLDCPFADGAWRGSRIHLIVPPASGEEPVLTIRKHPANPWTFERLRDSGWASEREIESVRSLVESRKNFLVVGGTGSGKTSVLNACLGLLPDHERVVAIDRGRGKNRPRGGIGPTPRDDRLRRRLRDAQPRQRQPRHPASGACWNKAPHAEKHRQHEKGDS